jgi:hypothetical protein
MQAPNRTEPEAGRSGASDATTQLAIKLGMSFIFMITGVGLGCLMYLHPEGLAPGWNLWVAEVMPLMFTLVGVALFTSTLGFPNFVKYLDADRFRVLSDNVQLGGLRRQRGRMLVARRVSGNRVAESARWWRILSVCSHVVCVGARRSRHRGDRHENAPPQSRSAQRPECGVAAVTKPSTLRVGIFSGCDHRNKGNWGCRCKQNVTVNRSRAGRARVIHD